MDATAPDPMTDRELGAEVLVKLPDGICFGCLAQKTGLEVQRVIAAVDAIPPLLLVVPLGFAPCPFCSERRRIVNIFHAP